MCCLPLPEYIMAAQNLVPGNIVFSSNISDKWDLWVVQPDGKGLRQITHTLEDELSASVSPDRNHILYADSKRTLQIMGTDGKNPGIIPLPPGIFAHPTWRPDGKEIMFVKYTVLPSDQGELWRMERHESGWKEPVRFSLFPPMKTYPCYSPDGLQLVYAEFRRDTILGVVEEIGIVNLAEKQFHLITSDQADAYQPVWSPKGHKIAYVSNKTGNYDIWIYDLEEKKHHPLTMDPAFDGDPAWSADGEEIAFVSARTGSREIWIISLIGDRLRQITHMGKTCSHPFWVK